MKSESHIHILVVVIVVILSVLAGLMIAYGTHYGPWADDDSAEYFEAARNLASGHGLVLIRASGRVSPLSSRTPFYSIVLGVAGFAGLDILFFSRWLDIVLFVILILVLGIGTYALSRNPYIATSLCALILFSPVFLEIYTSAHAEPLFFTLGITSFYLLILYFKKESRLLLTAASILAGLAFLSRYNGIAFIIAGTAGLIVFDRKSHKKRILGSAYFMLVSCLILAPWLIGVYRGGDAPGVYKEFSLGNLWDRFGPVRVGFVEGIWSWLPFQSYLPDIHYRLKLALLTIVCLIFILLFYAAIKRKESTSMLSLLHNPSIQLAGLSTFFSAINIGIIAISHVFMTFPQAMFIDRHLSPIQIGLMITFFSISYFIIDSYPSKKWFNLFPIVIAIAVVISNIPASLDLLSNLHNNGKGFTSIHWTGLDLYPKVSELPEDVTLISNESEAIVFWTNRAAYRVPEIWHRQPAKYFYRFGDDLKDPVQEIFREKGAALVLFNSVKWQFYYIYWGEHERRLEAFTDGLFKFYQGSSGTIYFYEPYEYP